MMSRVDENHFPVTREIFGDVDRHDRPVRSDAIAFRLDIPVGESDSGVDCFLDCRFHFVVLGSGELLSVFQLIQNIDGPLKLVFDFARVQGIDCRLERVGSGPLRCVRWAESPSAVDVDSEREAGDFEFLPGIRDPVKILPDAGDHAPGFGTVRERDFLPGQEVLKFYGGVHVLSFLVCCLLCEQSTGRLRSPQGLLPLF